MTVIQTTVFLCIMAIILGFYFICLIEPEETNCKQEPKDVPHFKTLQYGPKSEIAELFESIDIQTKDGITQKFNINQWCISRDSIIKCIWMYDLCTIKPIKKASNVDKIKN